MHYGDTVVLSTATASNKPREGIDFFPLSVEYEEKLYAVGKITEALLRGKESLQRMQYLPPVLSDRPMRPLFPKDYRNDVTLDNLVLCVDQDCSPELTAVRAPCQLLPVFLIFPLMDRLPQLWLD